MSTSPQFSHPCTLVPIDLHSQPEVDELLKQRKLCGWSNTMEYINKWRDMVDNRTKTMFWITLPAEDNLRAGHISLACVADPPDSDLAREDGSIMTISTFFIGKEHRAKGLGRKAMDILEEWAGKEPYGNSNCRVIAVDTLSKRYYLDDSDEWGGVFSNTPFGPLPKGTTGNEGWYERRGYVKFKEARRYKEPRLDGTMNHLVASFLKKEIK